MPVSPEQFVEVIGPAVRQAASIARALEGRVRNRPKWGEASAVKAALTLADSAAQEAILVPLLERFPEVALLAEEDTPSVELFPKRSDERVVIDPIDGTLRCYLEGQGPYAVMVGLARAGRFEAALVALPREGLLFDAVRGKGARVSRAGGAPRPARAESSGTRVLVSPDLPEAVAARLREAGLEVAIACGGAIAVAPLVPGVRAGLRVATGSDGVSPRGRIGALIAAAAGARVEDERGAPFPEVIDAPRRALLVSASEADARALREAVRALPHIPA
jgi:fructose-1,6-bisphosphatase/inositol monophosphatase family enzyme